MSKPTTKNQVLGHAAESDGIEEYDNALPNWWLGLFYCCIIWAFAYTAYYHFIARKSEVGTLAAEMAAANVRWQHAFGRTLDHRPPARQPSTRRTRPRKAPGWVSRMTRAF